MLPPSETPSLQVREANVSTIEPNILSLLWFTLFWALCCVGFLVLSGSFPLKVAKDRNQATSAVLAILNAGLMAVLVSLTLAFGYLELRVTTLIVVAGLVFLFAPTPFELWPASWRDGKRPLATLLIAQFAALAALYQVGGSYLDRLA